MQLDVPRLEQELIRTHTIGAIYYTPRTDSTNRLARVFVAGMEPGPFLVVTDYQEEGRGRHGRTWLAPAGTSLLTSVAVPIDQVRSSDVVLVAAVAVCRAVESQTGLHAGLKWPNDVLVGGRKVSGILVELIHLGRAQWAIVGTGINVNFDPRRVDGIPPTATSLQTELGQSASREALLVAYVRELVLLLAESARAPGTIFDEWKRRLQTLGQNVTVHDASGDWSAVALDVQRDGGLVVRDAHDRQRVVYAADVSLATS
ncbi:MAG: hypothetical protein NVS2B16_00540 [Chloroflexota bacterium]